MLTIPDPSKVVWNHCPYWGSFLCMNNSWFGCMAALGVRKQLGHSVPVWNWLLWTCLSGILDFGSLYLTYFVFIWVCSKQGCPPFRAEQIPLPKKHQSVLYTHYLCVHVWFLDWKGSKRESERKGVVCAKFPLTVTKEFQMKKSQRKTNVTWYRFFVTSNKMS